MQRSAHELSKEIPIRKASTEEKPLLKRVLARAFELEAWVNWFVLKDRRWQDRVRTYFDIYIHLPGGQLYTTPDQAGAALWFGPGQWELSFDRQLQLLPKILKATGVRKLPSRVWALKRLAERHPQTSHYYLLALGTEPTRQREGIGTSLLGAMLRRCDEASLPAYLETSEEENVLFYEKHGFEVQDEVCIDKGPMVRLMWRSPCHI